MVWNLVCSCIRCSFFQSNPQNLLKDSNISIRSQYWKSVTLFNPMAFFMCSWSESCLLNRKQHFFLYWAPSLCSQKLQWTSCWLWNGMTGCVDRWGGKPFFVYLVLTFDFVNFFLLFPDTSLPLSAPPHFSELMFPMLQFTISNFNKYWAHIESTNHSYLYMFWSSDITTWALLPKHTTIKTNGQKRLLNMF